MSEHDLSAQEFGALLRWKMQSDPMPVSEVDSDRVIGFLNDEAESRGYDDWVEAYHDFH
jgi:hypothetical protein